MEACITLLCINSPSKKSSLIIVDKLFQKSMVGLILYIDGKSAHHVFLPIIGYLGSIVTVLIQQKSLYLNLHFLAHGDDLRVHFRFYRLIGFFGLNYRVFFRIRNQRILPCSYNAINVNSNIGIRCCCGSILDDIPDHVMSERIKFRYHCLYGTFIGVKAEHSCHFIGSCHTIIK